MTILEDDGDRDAADASTIEPAEPAEPAEVDDPDTDPVDVDAAADDTEVEGGGEALEFPVDVTADRHDDEGPEEAEETAPEVEASVFAPVDEPPAALVLPAVAPKKLSRRAHRAEMKATARRVRRVVRHIDAWSVFKVASIFVACVWGIVVLASLLIWRAAVASGSVESTEELIVEVGFSDFNFDPEQMFRSLLSFGALLAVASVFFIVVLTVLFNLICDLTGGVRVTMIEQDMADARKRGASEGAGRDGALSPPTAPPRADASEPSRRR